MYVGRRGRLEVRSEPVGGVHVWIEQAAVGRVQAGAAPAKRGACRQPASQELGCLTHPSYNAKPCGSHLLPGGVVHRAAGPRARRDCAARSIINARAEGCESQAHHEHPHRSNQSTPNRLIVLPGLSECLNRFMCGKKQTGCKRGIKQAQPLAVGPLGFFGNGPPCKSREPFRASRTALERHHVMGVKSKASSARTQGRGFTRPRGGRLGGMDARSTHIRPPQGTRPHR